MRTDVMGVRGMRLDLHLSNRLVATTEWPRFTKGQKGRPSKDGLIFVLDVWNVNDPLGQSNWTIRVILRLCSVKQLHMAAAWPWRPWWCDSKRFSAIGPDRKSTRLNSSHLVISYAVFCLK